MYELSVVFFWSLVAIAAYNALWTVIMVGVLGRRRQHAVPADHELPKAAVLLCLRGADPGLSSCLKRLLSQDYPDYELFVAVDSKSDPAWDVVQSTVRALGATNVHVAPLKNRLSTCSLKCSSLVQLVDGLDDSHEVIVLADADLESHNTWLRELVAPLSDPKIGAAFGNRWFMPTKCWMGSVIRQLWNGPGIVVMHAIEIPWAGSLAIRADVVKHGNLRDKWSQAIVDDGPVRTAVKEQRLRLHFVPTLMMANREECSLKFACNFLRRQLTWTRTYVRTWWPAMLTYSFIVAGLWTAAVVLAVTCLVQGQIEAAMVFGSGAGMLLAVLTGLWWVLDYCVRRVVRAQGEAAPGLGARHLVQVPVAILVAVWVHVWATLVATFQRRIVWRGVTYEIRGPWHVRMIDDREYAQTATAQTTSTVHGVSI